MLKNESEDNGVADPSLTKGSKSSALLPMEQNGVDNEGLTTLHERTLAALSYISFLAIIPFYLKKDSKFCRFHGQQGLFLAILFFFARLFMVLNFFNDLILFLQFGIFVYMGLAALSGEWKKFPWIFETAEKLGKQLSLDADDEEPLVKGDVEASED